MTGLKKMKSKNDLDIIVKALASELQGYDGYFKQKREKNDKK